MLNEVRTKSTKGYVVNLVRQLNLRATDKFPAFTLATFAIEKYRSLLELLSSHQSGLYTIEQRKDPLEHRSKQTSIINIGSIEA